MEHESRLVKEAREIAGGESGSPPALFADAGDIGTILRYLAGASSVCWDNPAGAGNFDSDRALDICVAAEKRIQEILFREHGVIL